ncbi:YfcC family protein [Macrococcus lamae]|uniref:Putative basic amino acid antiporter YfcC n=1 Tax=Macrococcus lamae TaxID=198484 RepID=A0A4R6BX80_9STAP|nr:Na+/H+ antiporter NhaC family protein [Macrococcus lamae]TDM13025.1 putative basic amino acid antiporter YfcC [Macrococcus lamae]
MEKKIRMPHTYALLLFLVAAACLMTYIIPAGTFDRKEVDGRTEVVNQSYHQVSQTPVSPIEVFRAVPDGMIAGAEIIFYIFLVGGAFGIIHRTNAINAGVNSMMRKAGRYGKWLIPLTMILFSILGFTIGMSEEAIVFVPIGIALAAALGYDAIVGAAMVALGAGIGFLGGMLNPFTVGVAQKIAEIPLFSGWLFRTIVYLLVLLSGIIYVMWYAERVRKNPEKSIVNDIDIIERRTLSDEVAEDEIQPFNQRHAWILLLLLLTVIINVYGIFKYEWFLVQMSANFLILGIVAGLIGGLGLNGTFDAMIEGMKDILYGALIVGFARAIVVVLEAGKIIDTIVYYMTDFIDHLPAAFSVVAMFFTQLILNFFIPSGSGQAMTTMPIMVPIADLLDINRQLAVLAFQYGDAISNNIIPTSASLMGLLAVAGIPYTKWLKFVWKISLIWVVICLGSMIVYLYIT